MSRRLPKTSRRRPRPAPQLPLPTVLAVLAVLASACAAPEPEPATGDDAVLGAIGRGSFLPVGTVADFRIDLHAEGEVSTGEYWVPEPLKLGSGWSRPSPEGVWGRGERSSLLLRPRSAGASELLLDYLAPTGHGQRFRVEHRGTSLAEVVVEVPGGSVRLALPESALVPGGEHAVDLVFEPPVEPPGEVPVPAIAFSRFGLLAPGAASDEGRPPGFKVEPARASLLLLESGSFLFPLRLPAASSRLAFELRYRGAETEGSSRLRLLGLGLDGREQELLAVDDLAALDAAERAVSLTPWAGRLAFFVFEVELPAGARLEVRSPRLEAEAEGEREPRDERAAEPPERPATLPDVVVIILDAARADRFGAYGYARETTPHIDRMAAEGIVFRRAYSECPNTSCSVPNMISGLPFIDPGEQRENRRLDDSVETLAESLKGLGYRTVGYSGNPNNSISRNTHQGFDEYHEMWQKRRGAQRRAPHLLSRLAIETIEAQPAGEPLYLQLHYVPPHEPYKPLPRFDVFTDPAYDGPVDGDTKVTRAFRAGELEFDAADLQQLIDLYDGNLLTADDAVGKVFDALRAAGRWDDALVLVTSDHGEAFLEHGRQGHNSTVYDEMLHVPFILRLPGGEVPAGVDPGRLASLADILPTVLGRLGLTAQPGVVGVDLVASESDPERVTFHRTRHTNLPTYAARTLEWKALTQPGVRRQELFHYPTDPGEKTDLLVERPRLYSALTTLLREHVALAERLGTATGDVELSDEDAEMLRSLGYL